MVNAIHKPQVNREMANVKRQTANVKPTSRKNKTGNRQS